MIFLRGNLWRTLWFLCLMLPLAQGLRLCVWAASTCWCLCLSPVPCSSWPPGLASHFMAASCKESRPWGKEPSMATLLMSRPYELKGAGLKRHFKVVHFTIRLIMSEKELKQKAAVCQYIHYFKTWLCGVSQIHRKLTNLMEEEDVTCLIFILK